LTGGFDGGKAADGKEGRTNKGNAFIIGICFSRGTRYPINRYLRTFFKDFPTNVSDTVRNGHRGQAFAIVKGLIADGSGSLGYFNAGQADAVGKSGIIDVL
jgi:hypothetical protein